MYLYTNRRVASIRDYRILPQIVTKKTEDRKRKREQKNNGASSLLFRMYAKPMIELKKNYFGLKL